MKDNRFILSEMSVDILYPKHSINYGNMPDGSKPYNHKYYYIMRDTHNRVILSIDISGVGSFMELNDIPDGGTIKPFGLIYTGNSIIEVNNIIYNDVDNNKGMYLSMADIKNKYYDILSDDCKYVIDCINKRIDKNKQGDGV